VVDGAFTLEVLSNWADTITSVVSESEKDATLAQMLVQLQPFTPVFPRECMGQPESCGQTEHLSRLATITIIHPSPSPTYHPPITITHHHHHHHPQAV
jgi:hypothetical protein